MSWQNDLKKMLGLVVPMIMMTNIDGRTIYFKFQNSKFYLKVKDDWKEIILVKKLNNITAANCQNRQNLEKYSDYTILDTNMSTFRSFAICWAVKGIHRIKVRVKGFKI